MRENRRPRETAGSFGLTQEDGKTDETCIGQGIDDEWLEYFLYINVILAR